MQKTKSLSFTLSRESHTLTLKEIFQEFITLMMEAHRGKTGSRALPASAVKVQICPNGEPSLRPCTILKWCMFLITTFGQIRTLLLSAWQKVRTLEKHGNCH